PNRKNRRLTLTLVLLPPSAGAHARSGTRQRPLYRKTRCLGSNLLGGHSNKYRRPRAPTDSMTKACLAMLAWIRQVADNTEAGGASNFRHGLGGSWQCGCGNSSTLIALTWHMPSAIALRRGRRPCWLLGSSGSGRGTIASLAFPFAADSICGFR